MKILLTASALTAAVLSTGASAQRLSPTVIAVVDTDRVSRECVACKAAQTQLRTQLQAAQTRATQLRQPVDAEGTAITTALRALAGRPRDAAMQARITAFEGRQQTLEQQLAVSENTLRSTQAHVNQQIGARLRPIFAALQASRGATIIVDKAATLFSAPAIDVTSEVIAQLDRVLPSVSVTPLPAQPAPATPQGR